MAVAFARRYPDRVNLLNRILLWLASGKQVTPRPPRCKSTRATLMSNLHEVRRIVAISPAGFVPRVPPLYYLLRACASKAFCSLQKTTGAVQSSLLGVGKACWCCLIPLAPHVLCTCWYKKERFTRPGDTK